MNKTFIAMAAMTGFSFLIMNQVNADIYSDNGLTHKYLFQADNGTSYTCSSEITTNQSLGCVENKVIYGMHDLNSNSTDDGKKELNDFLDKIIPELEFMPLQGA